MNRVKEAVGSLYAKMGEYNIPATKLADASGVTRITLSNWRHGKAVPSLDKYLQVADALNQLVQERQNVSQCSKVSAE
jgi:transcriptional regulator with XRE-family HTH domain